MKNTNDFHSHETTKIFKIKEPATKIYDIPVYADAAKPSARGFRAISPHSESHFAGS